ncbi:MAG TPA: PA2169 family four-helix-bundle protein [Rariglobus sp.]
MNSDIKSTIKTLNDLIETLRDGQHGFKTAAEDVKASELAQLFNRYSVQRGEFVAELQARVLALGADVEKSGSVSGSVHRGWINLKAALSSNEPHAVLAECERGEDSAVAAYKEALDNQDLDLPTRELLNRQYHEVKGAHDKVKQLRDGVTYRKAS